MLKFEILSSRIKTRIAHGDYALKEIPAERQLASEAGVSYMTARRALQQLVEDGVLVRAANGRLEVNRSQPMENRVLQLAFLAPSFASHSIDCWRHTIEQVASRHQARLRQVQYVHWDDPTIRSSLDGFDGVFLLPSTESMPPEIVEHITNSSTPIVVLDLDFSHRGIPSLRRFPPVFVQRLLDHLDAQGHNNIACLNVQPHDEIILGRLEQWRIWMAAHRYSGQLIDQPVNSYSEPFTPAYEEMKRVLSSGAFSATALMCLTTPAAVGAMRALHEAGIAPGKDVAICSIDGENLAAFQIPSLTALEPADVTPHLEACLEWMKDPERGWKGPLLMQPTEAMLDVRESTQSTATVRSGLEKLALKSLDGAALALDGNLASIPGFAADGVAMVSRDGTAKK